LHLHNDVLTVRGDRKSPMPPRAQYFYQETFWGRFSRTVVLPVEVKVELAKAEYKNGTLMIVLPKVKVEGKIPIIVVDE
jgi:HSP20 family protein